MFKNSLKKWSINYDLLEENKAGAACIGDNTTNPLDFKAVGFSYQMFDIQYAKKVALKGCNEMRKKEILSSCSCEIIIVNNRIEGDN